MIYDFSFLFQKSDIFEIYRVYLSMAWGPDTQIINNPKSFEVEVGRDDGKFPLA